MTVGALLQPVDPEQARRVLWRDPLRNVVLLKFLLAFREGATVYQALRGDRSATLLVVDHRVSAYDRQTYPAAKASVLVSSNDSILTRELLAVVSPGDSLIFKLARDEDLQIVAERFSLSRVTAFHSYTAANGDLAASAAQIGDATDAPFHLFEAQGHEANWLRTLLEGGKAFTSVVREEREVAATCFAFQIDDPIWEIGGVYTRPECRGRGLGKRAVQAALAELKRRDLVARYQVSEDNAASIGIAASLGMERFLTLTHYRCEAQAA